ncbi:uncharacterized protein [Oscarella lobularis]|uniref:uncharacterized protein n=1 Tax=Oscarella lobularis TaxID=121494 RepID=UPI003313AC05
MASQCKERSIGLENTLLSGQSSTAMAKPPPARLLSTEKEKPKLLAGSSLLRTAPLLSQTGLRSGESNSKPLLPLFTLKSRLPSSTSLTGPPLGKPLLTQSSLQLSGNISSSSRPLTSGAPKLSSRPTKSSGPRLISSVHEQKRATNLLLKQKLGFSSLESSSIRRKLVEPKKRNAQASETEPVARPIELESTDGFCLPEYDLGSVDESPLDIVKSALASMNFPTEEERRGKQRSVALAANKTLLLNCVATSLLQLPDFRNPSDPTLSVILETCRQISLLDPEFILKVALYARCELNIQSVANFLLAVAANCHTCRPYIKKYFSASIRLPSDWIDVAEMYQAFHDHTVNSNLLFVNVDLSGTKCSISTTSSRHENDVFIAGYSDQILRFIAERGGGGQLAHVENIDKAHRLTDVKQPAVTLETQSLFLR